MLGPHRVRGAGHGKGGGGNPDLIYHNGAILPSVTIKAIFWGTGWASPANKITGLDKFYANIGTTSGGKGSAYDATVNEFTDNSGQMVSTATTYQGHLVDTSAVPRKISTSAFWQKSAKKFPIPQPMPITPFTLTSHAVTLDIAPTTAGANAEARISNSDSSSTSMAIQGAIPRARLVVNLKAWRQ